MIEIIVDMNKNIDEFDDMKFIEKNKSWQKRATKLYLKCYEKKKIKNKLYIFNFFDEFEHKTKQFVFIKNEMFQHSWLKKQIRDYLYFEHL